MSKNIQVPVELLNSIARLLKELKSVEISDKAKKEIDTINTLLFEKLDKIKQREAFTAYKTNTGTLDERTQKKEEYIKLKNGNI